MSSQEPESARQRNDPPDPSNDAKRDTVSEHDGDTREQQKDAAAEMDSSDAGLEEDPA